MLRLVSILSLTLIFGVSIFAQQTTKPSSANQAIKSSPAYAEILLRKTELESNVESLLVSYTEEFPKLKESRYELGLIKRDSEKLLSQTDVSKLSLALGKLLVRRAELETNLWALRNQYGSEHPEVKRAQRKVLSYDNAVKEILP